MHYIISAFSISRKGGHQYFLMYYHFLERQTEEGRKKGRKEGREGGREGNIHRFVFHPLTHALTRDQTHNFGVSEWRSKGGIILKALWTLRKTLPADMDSPWSIKGPTFINNENPEVLSCSHVHWGGISDWTASFLHYVLLAYFRYINCLL